MRNASEWGSALFQREARDQPRAPARPQPGNAWLCAEDVARLLLAGEFVDAGVAVPASFAPQALESATSSVRRWIQEGRIFAIHDLYPRYQFDRRGRPYPAIEHVIARLGGKGDLRVGNWFATPNEHLQGRRPQELLATAPADVLFALEQDTGPNRGSSAFLP
jgi:hypothetical protein